MVGYRKPNILNETLKPTKVYFINKILQLEYMLFEIEAGFILERKKELVGKSEQDLEKQLIELMDTINLDTSIRDIKGSRCWTAYYQKYHRNRLNKTAYKGRGFNKTFKTMEKI